jgi:alpha-beta hydrolase superfamily lysophospholipase
MDTVLPSKFPSDQPPAPENGEPYRYTCPVDHHGNSVLMHGLRSKTPNQSPPLLFLHDVGERSDMYWNCLGYICARGFNGYIYDQRGHGQGAEISGHVDHFQDLVRDLLQVASWVRHLHNGEPPIIVGQGYGAIVATEFAAKHAAFVTGVVLAAPTLQLAWTPGPFKRFIIKVFSEFAPTVKVPKGLHPRFSNPLHRQMGKTMATRLIRSFIGPRQSHVSFAFARELFDAMEGFGHHFRRINKPTLILKPDSDEVAKFEDIEQIAASHQAASLIASKVVANVHHNGFNEGPLPMASILDAIIAWIDSAVIGGGSERK